MTTPSPFCWYELLTQVAGSVRGNAWIIQYLDPQNVSFALVAPPKAR